MIKHFSKWLELGPLTDHNNEGVAYAFLHKMLSSFGFSAKVLTNQGIEFQGDFQDLCEKALLDHWNT
jgi:hypothetical protein